MRCKSTDCALARGILEWNVPEEVLMLINYHLRMKGL